MCYKITKQSMSIQVVNIGTGVILCLYCSNKIALSHTQTVSPTLEKLCRPKTSYQHLK